MSEVKVTKFICNICGSSKTINENDYSLKEENGVPKGWVLVGLENPYVDRDFYDKHVCNSCVNIIVNQLKVRNK